MMNWTNVSTFNDVLAGANANTGGSFWTITLWFIWVVILITLLGFGLEVALLGASFITLMAGLSLLYLGLVNFGLSMGAFVGIILITFLWIAYNGRE